MTLLVKIGAENSIKASTRALSYGSTFGSMMLSIHAKDVGLSGDRPSLHAGWELRKRVTRNRSLYQLRFKDFRSFSHLLSLTSASMLSMPLSFKPF